MQRDPNGVPILGGHGVQVGPSGLVVQMQQPDGNLVIVPLELATFHVLVECREHLNKILDVLMLGPDEARAKWERDAAAAVIAEAEAVTGGNDDATQ